MLTMRMGETPVPIADKAVKPHSADDSAFAGKQVTARIDMLNNRLFEGVHYGRRRD